MSFLKSLFGGKSGDAASKSDAGAPAKAAREIEHNGFTIQATPNKEGSEYQTAGTITKEIDGVMREYKFVRAEKFASIDGAADFSITKGQQIVNEQGERIFR